jgi:hypothetical protein
VRRGPTEPLQPVLYLRILQGKSAGRRRPAMTSDFREQNHVARPIVSGSGRHHGGGAQMEQVFAPGCALMIYKPDLARRMLAFLEADLGGIAEHLVCCRYEPGLSPGSRVINVCAGCDRRYRELYEGISTISLWEVLAASTTFPFPDYGGTEMSILDACPTRSETRVHDAIRTLLTRMNVTVVEPRLTRTHGTCCGDRTYGELPVEKVKQQMRRRASEMPRPEVVVYCVSCVKAMFIGGRRPRYMVDLLFDEETSAGTYEPDAWHQELQAFIDAHQGRS